MGAVNVLISVFYYLGVVRAMYVERSANETQSFKVPTASAWVILVTSVAVVLITIVSPLFYDIALSAAKSFLQ